MSFPLFFSERKRKKNDSENGKNLIKNFLKPHQPLSPLLLLLRVHVTDALFGIAADDALGSLITRNRPCLLPEERLFVSFVEAHSLKVRRWLSKNSSSSSSNSSSSEPSSSSSSSSKSCRRSEPARLHWNRALQTLVAWRATHRARAAAYLVPAGGGGDAPRRGTTGGTASYGGKKGTEKERRSSSGSGSGDETPRRRRPRPRPPSSSLPSRLFSFLRQGGGAGDQGELQQADGRAHSAHAGRRASTEEVEERAAATSATSSRKQSEKKKGKLVSLYHLFVFSVSIYQLRIRSIKKNCLKLRERKREKAREVFVKKKEKENNKKPKPNPLRITPPSNFMNFTLSLLFSNALSLSQNISSNT